VAQYHVELTVEHVQGVELGGMGEHFVQQLGSQEVAAARTVVVRMAGVRIGERLEDAEGRLRVAKSEPRACQRLLVDARVDVG
jgi:hypothetical protein